MAASSGSAVKLGPLLKEIRIHLCQKSPTSKGVREFIEQQYVGVKQSNPKFPILVRECSGVQPRMWARYDYGRETSVSLENFTGKQVMDTLRSLAQRTSA